MALSPDGTKLAFVATATGGSPQLWVRPLDSTAAQPLAGTEDASFPFWSPDNRSLGFFAQGKLRIIDASGGAVQTPHPHCCAFRRRAERHHRPCAKTRQQPQPRPSLPSAGLHFCPTDATLSFS